MLLLNVTPTDVVESSISHTAQSCCFRLRTELTYVIDRDNRNRAVKGHAWTMARNLLEGESVIRARGNTPHRMIATHGMARLASLVAMVEYWRGLRGYNPLNITPYYLIFNGKGL